MGDHRGQPQRIGGTLYEVCAKTGKIRHATEQDAKDHAASLLTSQGERVMVYRCTGRDGCGDHHVGHRPRGAKKKGRKRG